VFVAVGEVSYENLSRCAARLNCWSFSVEDLTIGVRLIFQSALRNPKSATGKEMVELTERGMMIAGVHLG
jgi:hypothetical protein